MSVSDDFSDGPMLDLNAHYEMLGRRYEIDKAFASTLSGKNYQTLSDKDKERADLLKHVRLITVTADGWIEKR